VTTHALTSIDAEMWFDDRPGAEPATVFIHGLAASSQAFTGVINDDRLKGHRTVMPDLLGFGNSERPQEFGYTIEDHAATVIELLRSLHLDGFNIVGHSLGGAIAVLVAEALTDRVNRIVLVEANLDPGGGGMSLPAALRSEDDYISNGFAEDLSQCEGIQRQMMEKAAPVAVHRTSVSLVANTQPTIRARFLALELPRVFMTGERSMDESPPLPSGEVGDGLEERGIRRIIVPDAGHSMMFDNPAGFASAVAEALGEDTPIDQSDDEVRDRRK
jgi:pimeloyl-ACP methyl ester carboxylesterase